MPGMLRSMSWDLFCAWAVFAEIEPFGQHYQDTRDDHRAGTITAAIYNVNRDPKKRRRPFDWTDFMPTPTDHEGRAKPHRKPGAIGERKPITTAEEWKKFKDAFVG